jgi:hypothetical protein
VKKTQNLEFLSEAHTICCGLILEIKIIISHVQVTSHLSSARSLYVQDGAVGSSPHVDVKVCTIPDNLSAALILSIILNMSGISRCVSSRSLCCLKSQVSSEIMTFLCSCKTSQKC